MNYKNFFTLTERKELRKQWDNVAYFTPWNDFLKSIYLNRLTENKKQHAKQNILY